jgi:broad specificity phosphatase PhoE
LPIAVSPKLRTRQTAAPIERTWQVPARVEPRIAEIPSPTGEGSVRAAWLKEVMQRRWSELDGFLQAWRSDVLNALRELSTDTIVVSHFIAINVVVGYALGDDRVVVFRPDNCSCTLVAVFGDSFKLVELGAEATTRTL